MLPGSLTQFLPIADERARDKCVILLLGVFGRGKEESERERQIPYDIAYIWNLIYGTKEPFHKTDDVLFNFCNLLPTHFPRPQKPPVSQ